MLTLVLGGARSGKSRLAESLVIDSGHSPVYLATAKALDGEMSERIARHQQQRDEQQIHWHTIEEPIHLADTLIQTAATDRCILVDCLTLWLSNCLLAEDATLWHDQKKALLSILPQLPGNIIFVSNEVGHGIIPLGELNRRFVDESGWLHQAIAEIAQSVQFVMAGCVLPLK